METRGLDFVDKEKVKYEGEWYLRYYQRMEKLTHVPLARRQAHGAYDVNNGI